MDQKPVDPQVSSHINILAKCHVNLPPVYFSYDTNLAQDLINELRTLQTYQSRIQGKSELTLEEFPALKGEEIRDKENKAREQQQLLEDLEKQVQRMTEAYRKQTEKESDRIRKEVEKQRQRDIDLRKGLAELAIEHQKRQVDVESKYAKRELDRQRNLASASLERSMLDEKVEVNLETAAGSTHSGATTVGIIEKDVSQFSAVGA